MSAGDGSDITKCLRVYVRKGRDALERIISLSPPHSDWHQLLDQGWAIDGNAILKVVKIEDLAKEERSLVAWLKGNGYECHFE